MASSSPFAGSPFSTGVPGQGSISRLESVRLPASPKLSAGRGVSGLTRLASAIARLPRVPSSRGNAKGLFLP